MKQVPDTIIEDALSRYNQGEEISAILAHYSEYEHELEEIFNVITDLKQISLPTPSYEFAMRLVRSLPAEVCERSTLTHFSLVMQNYSSLLVVSMFVLVVVGVTSLNRPAPIEAPVASDMSTMSMQFDVMNKQAPANESADPVDSYVAEVLEETRNERTVYEVENSAVLERSAAASAI